MEIKCSRALFLSESGFTLRHSSPRPCGRQTMRGIEAAPALYPALQACGMTKRSGHGFTLIELLVVVLIIGILAAVALPQYNKAVKKAQGVEVLNAIDALDKALSSYYLTHSGYGPGDGSIMAEDLDVDIPVLKHWKYNNEGEPNGVFRQIGTGDPRQLGFLTLDNQFRVEVRWKDGKMVSKKFYKDKGTGSCSDGCNDFFNCDIQSTTYYPCGNPDNCPGFPSTECNIK